MIYFLTGFISGIIFSLTEFLHKKDISNTGITFWFNYGRSYFFNWFYSLCKKNNKLNDNQTAVNLLTIDKYKYIVILLLSMLIVAVFLMLLACICSASSSGGSGGSGSSNEKSYPIYQDAQRHIYDQKGNWVG